jgi:surfeit locus 1 family protein
VWQIHRRAWKLALIDRVAHRIHAAPVPAPDPADWPSVTRQRDEYLHVTVHGHFRNDRETLVQAATELGAGDWVLTPFVTDRGFTVLVNRGFVPPEHRAPASRASGQIAGEATVTGLLRITEPGGGFLRHNDPGHNRWFSRDVAAIARARALGPVAPYFIDADRTTAPPDAPVGGLTVVRFPNNHLVYAITWFGLAILVLIGTALLIRDEKRLRSAA